MSEKGTTNTNSTWGERTSVMMSGQPNADNKKSSLSTVGVDLGEWRYSKDFAESGPFRANIGRRAAPKNNPIITFYTWDFAGEILFLLFYQF